MIAIVVTGKKVDTPSKTVKVKKGESVTLLVSSDAADEIHVHGYDISKDVGAGATVEIAFVANLSGGWEVELEKAGTLLVKLQVQ